MPGAEELVAYLLNAARVSLPTLVTLLIVGGGLAVANRLLRPARRAADGSSRVLPQVIMLVLTAASVIAVIVSLPVGDEMRGQLLSLLGLLLSAAIALSSTSLIGNAMAGLMLRAVGNLREGDFVEIDGFRGRVSERGVLHVEIQTEERDLVTLPNLALVSSPVKVVRASGTIITADVSLGYDVPHGRVETLLVKAAKSAELAEPYVQVRALGDFSISYRVAGFLADTSVLISTKTKLYRAVLDALHGDGVEIVSPNFMNQRVLHEKQRFVPASSEAPAQAESGTEPDRLVFDKAERAAERTRLAEELNALHKKLKQLEEAKKSNAEDTPDAGEALEEVKRSIETTSRAIKALPVDEA